MSVLPVDYPRARPRNRIDHASVVLLRIVMAAGWHPEQAGRDLLRRLGDDRLVLELLRGRVARAMLRRSTQTDVRASSTIRHAISMLDEREVPRIPTQRTGAADA